MADIGDHGFRSDSMDDHKGRGKAAWIMVLDFTVKLILYYGHERAWNMVTWGRLAGDPAATAE